MRTKQDFIKVTTPYAGYVTPINTAGPILYPLNLRIATCIEIINANIPLFEIVGDKAIKLTLNNLLESTVESEEVENVTVEAEPAKEEIPTTPEIPVEEVLGTVNIEDAVTPLVDNAGNPVDLPEGDLSVAEPIKEKPVVEEDATEEIAAQSVEETVDENVTTTTVEAEPAKEEVSKSSKKKNKK